MEYHRLYPVLGLPDHYYPQLTGYRGRYKLFALSVRVETSASYTHYDQAPFLRENLRRIRLPRVHDSILYSRPDSVFGDVFAILDHYLHGLHRA